MKQERPYFIVAVLDWGLGHATRSIPVIEKALKSGYEPVIVSAGASGQLLQNTFPDCVYVPLPSLRIKYYRHLPFFFSLMHFLPAFILRYLQERKLVRHLVSVYNPAFILSDHIYGFCHYKIPSVLLIHQLKPKFPFPLNYFRKVLCLLHNMLLRRFDQIWIPDQAGSSLSGTLSDKPPKSLNVRYTGALSRLKADDHSDSKFRTVAVLSGPEPARSDFEALLLKQGACLDMNLLIIRGVQDSYLKEELPYEERLNHAGGNVWMVDFLNDRELNRVVSAADIVIARSGYSTIMDLSVTGKQAILVPTPGQSEQEYLAAHLKAKIMCYTVKQSAFDLKQDLKKAKQYKGFINRKEPDGMTERLFEDLVRGIVLNPPG